MVAKPKRRTRRKTSAKTILIAQRDKRVLEMRLAGYRFIDIATSVHVDGLPDLKNPGSACRIVQRHLAEYTKEPTSRLRTQMRARLEGLVQKLYPMATQGVRFVPATQHTVQATKTTPTHQEDVPAHQVKLSLETQFAAMDRYLRVLSDIRQLHGLNQQRDADAELPDRKPPAINIHLTGDALEVPPVPSVTIPTTG